MTPGDVARLLGTCALYDYREVDKLGVAAWFKVIGDLDYDDAIEAVTRHYTESTDRIMPAHVVRGVRAIQAERRRRDPSEVRALPSRFEDDINREVRLERGAATVRDVLGPLVQHIAASRPELPSALDELRELTAAPSGLVIDGEARE